MKSNNPKFNFKKPFAIIKRQDDSDVLVLEGNMVELDKLVDIPRVETRHCLVSTDETFDTLSFLPFSQIKERGFKARDDGAKILCLKIKKQTRVSPAKIISILPDEKVKLSKKIKYDTTEKQYAQIIKKVIKNEIGNGEGANFLIPRKGMAKIKNMTTDTALSIFKNILKNEIGSYWSFVYFTGKQYFIGATPERHLTIKNNRVEMNPISGTFRKNGRRHSGMSPAAEFKKEFKKFLTDQKEINELFMVVDEELKMMSKFCSEGGEIVGPLLKEMSKLIHTEYLLNGKSHNDIIDILHDSMYAATVVGSPIESACRVIYKYEQEARRYYGSALALIGRDGGQEFLDSMIAIRTVEIDKVGNLLTRVGATLVRDSKPFDEVKETKSKIAAMLDNIVNPPKSPPQAILPSIKRNKLSFAHVGSDQPLLASSDAPATQIKFLYDKLLKKRNKELSKFWFYTQENKNTIVKELKNKSVVIIDNEDDFCYMIKHILTRMGARARVVRYSEYDFARDNADITIVGPGTGNPLRQKNTKTRKHENTKTKSLSRAMSREHENSIDKLEIEKMKIVAGITEQLLRSKRKFLAVCLGQQFLCLALGIKVVRKKEPFQGVAKVIDFFGSKERVGFYNTFVGVMTTTTPPTPPVRGGRRRSSPLGGVGGVVGEIAYDKKTREIHALRGDHFAGLQFHAESILTQHGYGILKVELERLLTRIN